LGNNSIAIGRGTGAKDLLRVNDSNAFGIGFNATVPTLYVLGSATANSTGTVGIGTTAPAEALDIVGAMHITPQASPPSVADSGDLYMDSTPAPDELCVYDGSSWQALITGTDANCA